MKSESEHDEHIRPISDFTNDALGDLDREHEVKLDERGTLTFPKAPGYEMHVDDFQTRKGLLEWLWHLLISGKRWVTLHLLVDLLATIKGHDERIAIKRRNPSPRQKRQ